MTPDADRRRFSRLIVSLAVKYQTRSPESGELRQGEGVIDNISLSGGFFYVDRPEALRPGQLLRLTILAPMLFLAKDLIPQLTATGEVVRLEPPGYANPNYGVAVNFVENLSFVAA